MSARGFIGAGDLYVSRFDPATQAFLPFIGPIETTKFEITPKTELKEQVSKGRSSYGQVIESVALAQPFEFTADFAEVTGDTLVNAFLGTETAIAQTAGALAEVTLTAKLDGWVETGTLNLSAVALLVQDSTKTTTYVLDTDYQVNRRLGTIKALSGGAITADQVLKINGSKLALDGTLIAGGTEAQIRAKFKFDGKNMVDGKAVIVDVHEVVIAADSAFDFLADDFNTVSLPGKLKTPTGKSEPFTVRILDNAVA